MKKLNLETKVGIFFLVVFVLVAWISLKLGNYDFGEQSGYVLHAVFPTAAGLDPESTVLLAGLRIGKIESIRLENGKALVSMRVREEINVPTDSSVSIQSKGFLGARYMEIIPGSMDQMLQDGDRFDNVSGGSDLNAVTGDLQDIAQDIKAITANLREIFGTPEGEQGIMDVFENLQRISASLSDAMEENQTNFNKLVGNLERFTANLAYLSGKNREDLSEAMSAFPAIAKNLKVISENLAVLLSENNEEIGQSLQNLAGATEKLEEAMESVSGIARKIDEGEGTIGKLVNDDETVDNLNEAVTGINEFLNRVRKLQAEVAYRGEYDVVEGDAKSYFNLTLRPRKDKFYMVGVVDDPSGRTRTTDTYTETVTNRGKIDEKTVIEEEHKEVTSEELLLSAQLGKRWHDFVFRGGLIESKGGVGAEYYLWDDHINFTMEAFDFASDNNPRLKANMDVTFLKHFVVTGGVDDFINKYDDPRYFFGGGLKITDEDITVLFSRMPLPDL